MLRSLTSGQAWETVENSINLGRGHFVGDQMHLYYADVIQAEITRNKLDAVIAQTTRARHDHTPCPSELFEGLDNTEPEMTFF